MDYLLDHKGGQWLPLPNSLNAVTFTFSSDNPRRPSIGFMLPCNGELRMGVLSIHPFAITSRCGLNWP